jgi:FHA domain
MADHIPEWAVEPKPSNRTRFKLVSQPPSGTDTAAESWPLHKAAYLLGRNGQAVDICIAHKSASRVHACLAHDAAGELFLVELGSAHGAHTRPRDTAADGGLSTRQCGCQALLYMIHILLMQAPF